MRGDPLFEQKDEMDLKLLMLAALLVWTTGCGLTGDPTGPGDIERRTEILLESDEGLEKAVRIDSLVWRPFPPQLGFEDEIQATEGTFSALFINLTEQDLQVRYDLRFYDREDFLVDAFIPFGQPVRLSSREILPVEGVFRIRSTDPRDLERLAIMRLFARVAKPEN